MQITLFIGSLESGGAERQISNLARALSARGHSVSLVTLFPGGQYQEDLRRWPGIAVSSLWRRRRGRFLTFLQLLGSPILLRGHLRKGAILYSMLEISNLIAWICSRFVRDCQLVWGVRSQRFDFSGIMRTFNRLCAWVSPSVELVIVNSQAGREGMIQFGYRPKRIRVIPNGIDVDLFRFNAHAREELRTGLGVGPNSVLVGAVGRIIPEKDLQTFLRAAALVRGRHRQATYAVIGSGNASLVNSLQAEAASAGLEESVLWLGQRSDMPAVYSALDILVSSSRSEGFSNVVAEAMACGLPCVVTDVGDSAAIVGKTGLVVEPGSAEALAQAVSRLLGALEPRKRHNACRERIEKHFALESAAQKIEDAFRELQ